MEMTIITTMVSGIVIAFVSSWITVQLSLNRFRTERHWERRVKAYESVIEALYRWKIFLDNSLRDDGKVPAGEFDQLSAQAIRSYQEIERTTDMARFLLANDEAHERLKRYRKIFSGHSRKNSKEYVVYHLKIANSCLEDLIEIARRDLGFRGERGFFHFFKYSQM